MATLLVAVSGGHLTQLHLLAPRLVGDEEVVWMTNDTPQSRSLLAGQRVYHVPTRPPRDMVGVIADIRVAQRAMRENRIDRAISSGAQIALSAYAAALPRRIPFSYVESATRVTSISVTGKILERLPAVRRYIQYPALVSNRWDYALSVFDGFAVERREVEPRIERAVVTVGGQDDFGFRRLIEGAMAAIPAQTQTLWQVGPTDVSGLDVDAVTSVPGGELLEALRAADVVIGHAGTGTALSALTACKVPILVPRSVEHGEHIDGHQDDLAAFLAARGLAIVRRPDEITLADLYEAARFRVTVRDDLAPVQI